MYWAGASRPSLGLSSALSLALLLALLPAVAMAEDSPGDPGRAEPGSIDQDRIDFDTQIVPVLTRQGCNAGACHGAAAGRGGFKLSLFGSNASGDYESIVRQLEGRRINLAEPEFSLVLRKASESLPHGGGVRLEPGTDAYQLMRTWITQGAPRLQARQVVDVEVRPTQKVVAEPGDLVPVSVIATFDDGRVEDVTQWTVLTSDDPGSLAVDSERHRLEVRRRGEHVAIARFLDRVFPIRVALPYSNRVQDENLDAQGSIDRYINAQLQRLRIPASPKASDFEFVRRVWLDLAGRVPTPREIEDFVADPRSDKRALLVDELLASDEFADYWALKWANLLAIDSGKLQLKGASAYHEWITGQFRKDLAWDQAAFEMLTAKGDGFERGEVNFLRTGDGPDGLAEYATRVFMGVRLRCANCHNHPLDRWQQDDYHGLAAIFAKVRGGQVVEPNPRGEVTHPVTGEPARPKLPGDRYLDDANDPLHEFASWLVDPSNDYLARATVNRIWKQLMGRGLIEPVDDIRATNPATHPALLKYLSNQFAEGGFRFKPIIRLICNSSAYGRTAQAIDGNDSDTTYYSRALRRPLEAEVIADAIADVTGVPLKLGDESVDNAIQVTNNRLSATSLDILGRCDRSVGCEAPGGGSGSLALVLHFLNGSLVNSRLEDERCHLSEILKRESDDLVAMDGLYRITLARPLSDRETRYWTEQLVVARPEHWPNSAERRAFFEDVFWSLITSQAFLTNH